MVFKDENVPIQMLAYPYSNELIREIRISNVKQELF